MYVAANASELFCMTHIANIERKVLNTRLSQIRLSPSSKILRNFRKWQSTCSLNLENDKILMKSGDGFLVIKFQAKCGFG